MFRMYVGLIMCVNILLFANESDISIKVLDSTSVKNTEENTTLTRFEKQRDIILMSIRDFESKGKLLEALKKSNVLIQLSHEAIKLAEAYNIKANLLFSLEQYKKAETFFKKSYNINPSDLTLHNINESIVSRENLNLNPIKCEKYDLLGSIDFETRKPIVFNYFGEINSKGISFLVQTIMNEVSQGNCDFHINIDSTGGDPNNSFSAYNILKGLPISITTQNVNRVQSAAIHLFCMGDKRYVNPNSNFMIHAISWSVPDMTPKGLDDIKFQMNLQEKQLLHIYKECINFKKNNNFIKSNDDWYFNASKSRDLNLTQEITVKNFVPKKAYYFYN